MTSVLKTRIEQARSLAQHQYPDAKIQPHFYSGDILVAVFRRWEDGKFAGRMFRLVGETL